MLSFKEFINDEKVKNRNLHLEHIEDEILNFSYDGARAALNFIELIAGTLVGEDTNIDITAKWDGSPAIFVGHNPDNGKFFVSTKSLFNKNPKINYSISDIYENHDGELADKLAAAFKYLKPVMLQPTVTILQGDLLFTEGDVKHQTINETEYLTFAPNTITYAVPADTHLGNKINESKLGIIFHTAYEGESLDTLTASLDLNLHRLKRSKDVWFDDASYLTESDSVNFTEEEANYLNKHFALAEDLFEHLHKSDLDAMVEHPHMVDLIKIYMNTRIRNKHGLHNPSELVEDLIEFIHHRIEDEKKALKTEAARDRRQNKKEDLHAFIESEREMLETVFEFQKQIVIAKALLLKKLGSLNDIGTFMETPEGYVATEHEGFVVVDCHTSRAVKLVDRFEFSRANFLRNRK